VKIENDEKLLYFIYQIDNQVQPFLHDPAVRHKKGNIVNIYFQFQYSLRYKLNTTLYMFWYQELRSLQRDEGINFKSMRFINIILILGHN
jgi:hypothetical protein